MDKTVFYNKLDISTPEEFRYYENLSSLLEEDDYIDANLIADLIKDIDIVFLMECTDSYFEEFLKSIPDEETDLYIVVESIKRRMLGLMELADNTESINDLADEIVRFRNWYVSEKNVFDKINAADVSVRDARYDIIAAGLLGEDYSFDFRCACGYELDGYDVMLSDIIDNA